MIRIQPEQFLAQMRPNDAAIKSYYDLHQTEFQVPEQVRVEYLVLSLDELAKQIRVEADETRKYFEEHKDGFGRPEERQASHILISVATTASDAEKAAARAKAEQLLAQIKQTPKIFADLARQQSQDPGSAVKGGDLGFFGRGMMVKSFEDAVFQMKLEEVRGPIQTDFGFHIIKLSAIKLGVAVNFDDVKHQAEQELKKQKAEKAFGEMAEGFGNSVYEQSDGSRGTKPKQNTEKKDNENPQNQRNLRSYVPWSDSPNRPPCRIFGACDVRSLRAKALHHPEGPFRKTEGKSAILA